MTSNGENIGRRGFASMTPERLRQVASKGGKGASRDDRTFRKHRDIAKSAGKIGGKWLRKPKGK